MLRLYDARNRLVNQKKSGSLDDAQNGSDLVLSHLPTSLVILPDSLDVQTAQTHITDTNAHAFLVSRGDIWLGIVRRESLEIIERSKRFEAMQLPLTSIMIRSFILIPDSSALVEAADEFIHKRALGAVLVSDDGLPVNVVSVDWLESCLRYESEGEELTQPVHGARQSQRV